MNSIVRCLDGTYVDLSKIVAISPIFEGRGDFTEVRQFNIYFLPEGIPFKQDHSFSITISKEYRRPSTLDYEKDEYEHIKHPYRLTEKGEKEHKEFLQKCTEDAETSRLELATLWTKYKNTILK